MAWTLILADDHRILRDGLRAILEKLDGRFRVVGEAADGLQAVRLCRELQPDIAILGAEMAHLGGVDAAAELQHRCPRTKVVILSMFAEETSVVQAIRFGAKAYILKSASAEELTNALETVAASGSYLSPAVSEILFSSIQRGNSGNTASSLLHSLSPREVQVLRLVAEGRTSKEIAVILDLGLETVRSYRKTLMKKTGVNNIAGLTQLAISAGLSRSRSLAASA